MELDELDRIAAAAFPEGVRKEPGSAVQGPVSRPHVRRVSSCWAGYCRASTKRDRRRAEHRSAAATRSATVRCGSRLFKSRARERER